MKKILLILTLLFTLPALMPEALRAESQIESGAVHSQQLEVKAIAGALELSASHDFAAPARFMIYSITGQMVKSVDVAPGTTVTVDLPAGYYVVKTAKWSKRVVVK